MSVFKDNTKIPAEWKELQQKEAYLGLFILETQVLCAGVANTKGFVSFVEEIISQDSHPISPIAKNNIGRAIKIVDCSTLLKGDALGTLYFISKMDIEKRPIIIIENITDIPLEDTTHDNPKYVENLLLNGWKETIRYFTGSKYGDFSLETKNYTILIPFDITKKEAIQRIWHRYDGFAWIEDFDKDLKGWMETGFDEARDYLLKMGHIISLAEG